jgi:phage terminase small subunit
MRKLEAYKKLKPATKRWINSLCKDYELESYHERLLLLCGQAWDRAQEARAKVDEKGPIVKDRFEQDKPNPAIDIERQSMLAFTRILRELGLDLNPDDSRPPRQY